MMRNPLPFAVSFVLAALLALILTGVVLASPAEAAPPLPPAPAAGNVATTNSADEVTAAKQPSAPLDIPSSGITVTVDIPLTAGWNLIAIPVKRTSAHTAQSALNEIASQTGNCSEVDRWLNGGWDAHINGLPFNDFGLDPGKGYFIKCTTPVTWRVTGELIMAPVPLDLTPGWNLVALPYGPHADQAQAWLNDIIAQGGTASEVDRWLNGGWDAHINGLPFNDFAISKTQGYFVKMSNAVSYVPKPPTQNVCGAISTNTTWTDDKIWLLTCNVTVNSDVTLAIESGAIVKANPGVYGSGLTVNGTVSVEGTQASPVVFTSYKDDSFGGDTNGDGSTTQPAPGDWYGITLGSGINNSSTQNLLIRYAQTGLRLDYTSVSLSGVTIEHSFGTGIVMQGYSTNVPTVSISDSTIRDNNGGLSCDSYVNLILDNVTITDNTSYGIYCSGANYYTSVGSFSLVNSTISSNEGVGVILSSPRTNITIANSTISDNTDSAVHMNFAGLSGFTNNSISGNGFTNSVVLREGSLSGSATMTADIVWVLSPTVSQVSSDATLTIQSGAIIKINPGVYSNSLTVNGTLLVQGTPASPVVFTSYKDDSFGGDTNGDGNATQPAPGDWYGIRVEGMGTATLNESVITYANYGMYTTNGQVAIHNSIVSKNLFGIYNSDQSTVVDARFNWWGSDSGPVPRGSGNSINYRICYDYVGQVYYICHYYVDAYPWIGMDVAVGGQLGHAGPTSSNQAFEADPVNTANGNYAYQRTDVSIPTRGLPLEITRAYNSLIPQAGPLGFGWTHTWHLRLAENSGDNTVVVTFGDGHSEKWTWTGSAYDGASGVHGVLVKNGDGSFDLTQKDQTHYHFTPSGKLAWAEDRNANRTTLDYDGSGKLITVTEPAGRTLTLEYTSPVSPTLISRITDHVSRITQYMYDTTANLVTVTDVTGQATTMTYDANHRLLTMTDANGHTFVRNVYDTNGRVTEQYNADNNKWTFAYDEPGHFTLVTDPRNFVTTYTYDADWRLISEKDPLNYTVAFAYDADNNRTRMTDKRGSATFYAYDDRGNTTFVTDTLGGVSTLTYDTTGTRNNLLSQTDALNRTISYAYDGHSNLVQRTDPPTSACPAGCITTWTYDAFGQLATVTDANSHTTTTVYNANGDLTSITDALSHTTSAACDSAGRKLSTTDALGRTTSYTYDQANRLLTVSEPLGKTTAYTYDVVGNRTQVTENGVRVTSFAYDAKDRLVSVTDPLDHTTTYGYDVLDNQTSVTDPLGHVTTSTYDALNQRTSITDALNHTTTYQYDANGNRTRLTDANNQATNYTYDALNRLTGVTDAAGGTVSYGYDAVGNRLSMTDANSHTTTYSYDALNRLATVTDPLGHLVSYGYDGVGNRTSTTKADGVALTYGFDDVNRPVTLAYPGGAIAYGYDAAGNRTSLTDPTGTTIYTYDDLDRLIQVAGPKGALSYTYDLFGSRTSITYPGGDTVVYTYDAANRLSTVTDYGSRVTRYAYDDANRPIGIAYPNGVQAVYTYDSTDRLLSLVHTSPVSGTIASATYTLDNVGNRLTMVDLDGTSTYSYDQVYRLTQVIYPGGETVSYTYDPMGNRLSMTSSLHGTTSYSYDDGDRLLSFTDPGGTTTLTWDANGNMTGKGGAVYTFDALDRLVQVVAGATTVQFAYNGDGVRLGKTVNGVATDYLQDVAAPLPVVLTETSGGQTSRYVYGSDLLMLEDPANTPFFYHADGLGSTRSLSNLAGQKTDGYSYDVFGAQRNHAGNTAQPHSFTGEQLDAELGLVFLRARYYDYEVGRFVSRDPIPPLLMLPQTVNPYPYAENNPTLLTDPSGELPPLIIGAVLVVGGGIAIHKIGVWIDDWSRQDTEVEQQMEINRQLGDALDAGDLDRAADLYNERGRHLSEEVLPRVGKTIVDTPYGTSLNGPPPTGLGFWDALGEILDFGVEKTVGFINSLVGTSDPGGVQGIRTTRSSSFANAGSTWSGPPSRGK